MVQCVETYLAAASNTPDSLKYAATLFLDEDNLVEPDDAINTWPTLQRTLQNGMRIVTRSLHRLICYVNSWDLRRKGHIGDSSDKLALSLYSDADFAGDKESSKSTTWIFMALTGPDTFFPLNGVSKKQTCVSHNTPEAESVAANAAVRLEGLPALQLWDTVVKRKVIATLF